MRGREREREENINVWMPLIYPLLGTWPATQACAATGNQTSDSLVRRPALNPLNHTSQGYFLPFVGPKVIWVRVVWSAII